MADIYQHFNSFLNTDFRKNTFNLLRGVGFQISSKKEIDSRKWSFYLKPNGTLVETLSIKQELLFWVADFDEYQIRTTSDAMETVAKDPRLTKELIIIVTRDPDTSNRVRDANSELNIVGFSIQEIEDFAARESPIEFLKAIQFRSYTKDQYWTNNPIKNHRYFYGHNTSLKRITSSLANSSNHVAVLGLRKMGKTSFLYRLLEILGKRNTCHLCYLDVEIIGSAISKPSVEYFLWSLGQIISVSVSKLRIPNFQLFGRYPSFFSILNKESVPDLFIQDFQLALSLSDKTFIVAIDEVELMAPPSIIRGSNWSEDTFIRIWRILRGLAQQNSGRISYFITGTNPKFVEASKIGEVDNPIYSYFSKEYLSPLGFVDTKELLQGLGNLMGLYWSEEAIGFVHNRIGGHPLLVRAYGSIIHRANPNRETVLRVTLDDVVKLSSDFMLMMEPQLSQMLDVIRDYYSDEYALLDILADGKIGEFKQLVEVFPAEIEHLRGYGLLEFNDSRCAIAIEPLQTWIQRKKRPTNAIIGLGSQSLIGKSINGYELEASIGHSGGFADVYKAKSHQLNEYVAVKVLKNGLLLKLQQEVDALSKFNHPNIVKIISHGVSEDGLIYLMMEHLNGHTLRRNCERSFRLTSSELKVVTMQILEALIHIHPNTEKLEMFKSKSKSSLEMQVKDYEEYQLALVGRVHRDIKPENIMRVEGRGCILIDFNISVAASDPIKTMTCTPGYLPPDISGAFEWTQDIDLYQLGITLIQAATGIEYQFDYASRRSNVMDISTQLKIDVPGKLSEILLKLCAPHHEDRYISAQAVLKDLKKL